MSKHSFSSTSTLKPQSDSENYFEPAQNTSTHWPISSTPIKKKNTSNEVAGRKKKLNTKNSNDSALDSYVQRTSGEKTKNIQRAWAQFFYKVRNIQWNYDIWI